MHEIRLTCWRCGAAVGLLPLPLPRAEMCSACNADLHVCRQCRFYDPGVAQACREPVAEAVADKTRANFCGYFTPLEQPATGNVDGGDRAALDALFGLAPGTTPGGGNDDRAALDALFGLGGEEGQGER